MFLSGGGGDPGGGASARDRRGAYIGKRGKGTRQKNKHEKALPHHASRREKRGGYRNIKASRKKVDTGTNPKATLPKHQRDLRFTWDRKRDQPGRLKKKRWKKRYKETKGVDKNQVHATRIPQERRKPPRGLAQAQKGWQHRNRKRLKKNPSPKTPGFRRQGGKKKTAPNPGPRW